jgi:alkylation response protein AidB-like acyl-CoA dehydrogenase
MDFNDTPEEAAFRKQVRTWLDANATRKDDDRKASRARIEEVDALPRAREWQAKKAKAGYARITWPKEYGGMGGTPIQQVIYNQEEEDYLVPLGFFEIGLGMCIPTVMAYAKPEVLQRYVKPALHGEEIWCQLFSEPDRTSPASAPRLSAMATTGSSTARRCGLPARIIAITASSSPAPTPPCRSTRA